MIQVTHFQRKPGVRSFSIERLFRDVRTHVPADISCKLFVAPFASQGLIPRLRNIWAARRHQSAVNHITGDVHFLSLGLSPGRTLLSVMDCGNLVRLSGWRRMVMRWLWFSWPISCCRLVTALSEATRRDLIELAGTPPAKIRVVYASLAQEFVPQQKQFNTSCPAILMVGTAPNKNLERMAAALEGLDCSIELIGWPTPEQEAAFAASKLNLRVLGDVGDEEMLKAYHRCDLLLFASTLEGFGMPIVEAQAVGRAVITGNCSAMPEVAGGGACMVDPTDTENIRAGVQRVVTDQAYREQLIAKGYVNARRFSARKIASDYAEIYREMARLDGGRDR